MQVCPGRPGSPVHCGRMLHTIGAFAAVHPGTHDCRRLSFCPPESFADFVDVDTDRRIEQFSRVLFGPVRGSFNPELSGSPVPRPQGVAPLPAAAACDRDVVDS